MKAASAVELVGRNVGFWRAGEKAESEELEVANGHGVGDVGRWSMVDGHRSTVNGVFRESHRPSTFNYRLSLPIISRKQRQLHRGRDDHLRELPVDVARLVDRIGELQSGRQRLSDSIGVETGPGAPAARVLR